MAQNPVLSRLTLSLSKGLPPAVLASAALAVIPWQLISEAQEQAPAAQSDREFLTAEEFARRAGGDESSRDRAAMEVYSGAPVEGRQPVREFGGKQE